jgi:two-component system response regulator RegX3
LVRLLISGRLILGCLATQHYAARILVVEDDPLQAELLSTILHLEGHAVTVAQNGAQALVSARAVPAPELILVDMQLPDLNGAEIVRRLRATSSVPIILVTARRHLTDKVVGLDAGADDFVPKPFEPAELLARVRAHLRRGRMTLWPPSEPVIRVGHLAIDRATHEFTVGGQSVGLSPREFAMLNVLAEAGGRVVTRAELLARIWGANFFGDEGALDVYMRRLRAKIEVDSTQPRYLHTVRGIGFRLAEESFSKRSAGI